MLFALLSLIAVLQTQSPKPETVQTVSAPTVTTAPTAATAPAAPTPSAAESPAAEAAPAEVEPEPEVEAPLPTRQVCRYVEVTGQRFPVRTCRTVTIYPDETH
jgi:uncharacterized membrane protein